MSLHSFNEVRTASETGAYSLLELSWFGDSFAAVAVARREGGLLLALPHEAIPEEALVAAADGGFPGLLGPHLEGSCTLRGARDRELATSAQVLLVDLDLAELTASDATVALSQPAPERLVEIAPFALLRGRPAWPSAEGLRRLRDSYGLLVGAQAPVRASPYATGESGGDGEAEAEDGLPLVQGSEVREVAADGAAPAPPDVGAILQELSQQIQRLTTSPGPEPRDPPVGALAKAPAPGAPSHPALFDLEGARAGLSGTQLSALLAAAGRPPVRLNE